MLLMKKVYFDAIRSGAKRTTLRYWRHRRTRPGSVHLVPGLGRVRITEARQVAPADLTDRDAQADGFDGLSELHQALERLYLLYKIEAGISQADAGELVSQEEARERMSKWLA